MNGIMKILIFLFVLAFGEGRPLGKIHRPYQEKEESWGFDGDDKSPLTAKHLSVTDVQEKLTGRKFLQSHLDLDMDDLELNSQYDKFVVKYEVSFKRSHTDDGDDDDDSNDEIFDGFDGDDYDDYDHEMCDEYEIDDEYDDDDDEMCGSYDDGDDDGVDDHYENCHDCLGENDDDDEICDDYEEEDDDDAVICDDDDDDDYDDDDDVDDDDDDDDEICDDYEKDDDAAEICDDDDDDDDDGDDDDDDDDDYDNVSDEDEIDVMLRMIDGSDNGGITDYIYF